ncbi:MAG: pantoate--beta-alanine ligase [Myxococcota bacterium]|nr:pantoate--beta-alanine ligase [Myxococcota bacterium]
MRRIEHPEAMHAAALRLRREGIRVGFVPTMGFLHEGHLSLMRLARKHCDHVVVSIYVNPLQFGPNEDLEQYPRDLEGDAAHCASAGVDSLFVPTSLYEDDHSTRVCVDELTQGLCGATRPGHFDGVTTVVARLFGIVQPDVAVFGEKDFQQLAVIRRMVRDLCMPIDIIGGPLVRDDDGLALSSRNKYLDAVSRTRALSLHRALHAIKKATTPSVAERLQLGRELLDADEVDYLAIVDPDSLRPLEVIDGPARALVAARIGTTRLIDNLGL